MLTSTGKSSAIAEILTIRFAASQLPGERNAKLLRSSVTFVHLGGIVQDMPCLLHLISSPPASAAVSAAFGCAFSAVMSLDEDGAPEPPLFELEFPALFNLLVKLQSDNARPSTIRIGICFMVQLAQRNERAVCFYDKRSDKSMFFATLTMSGHA